MHPALRVCTIPLLLLACETQEPGNVIVTGELSGTVTQADTPVRAVVRVDSATVECSVPWRRLFGPGTRITESDSTGRYATSFSADPPAGELCVRVTVRVSADSVILDSIRVPMETGPTPRRELNVTLPPATRSHNLTFDDAWAIYETHVDSLRVRLVMQDTLSTYDLSWSPDGREVAFTRQYFEEGQYYYRVVIYDAVDGTQRVLTQGPDDSFQPAWSPDGARIAYLSRPLNGFDATLRIVQADGTGGGLLGSEQYYVRPPRWSPDGQFLAATRSDLTVVILRAMTGSVVRAIGPGMSPTWSPDGRQLAYVADGITVVDADGSNPKQLPLVAYDPAWSPDGDWIAFDTGGDVYLLSLDAFVSTHDTLDSSMVRRVGPYIRPAWRLRQ